MMQYVKIKEKEGFLIISLNRPEKCNALHGDFCEELLSSFIAAKKNPNILGMIIKGEGAHFCGGADLAWMLKMANAPTKKNIQDAYLLAEVFKTLYSMPKLTICLVEGMVIGGGLGLLAASDIVVAEEQAQFALREIYLGLTPAVISPYIIRAIGERKARYYILTGETFNTTTALQLGLAHLSFKKTEHEKIIDLLINRFKFYDKETILLNKKLITTVSLKSIDKNLQRKTAILLAKRRATIHVRKKLQQFLNNREKS